MESDQKFSNQSVRKTEYLEKYSISPCNSVLEASKMRLSIAFTLCLAVSAQSDEKNTRCVILLDVYNRSDSELRNLTRFTDNLLEAFANPGDKAPGELRTAMMEFGRKYSQLGSKDSGDSAMVHTVMNFAGPPVKDWASNVPQEPPVVGDTMPLALRKAQEMFTKAKTEDDTVDVIVLISKGRPSTIDDVTTASIKQQGTKIFTILPIFPTEEGHSHYLPSPDVFLAVNMFASDESFAKSSEEILSKTVSLVGLPSEPSPEASATTPSPQAPETRDKEVFGIAVGLLVVAVVFLVVTILTARKILKFKKHKKHRKHGKRKKKRRREVEEAEYGWEEGEEGEVEEEYPAEPEETAEVKDVESKEGIEKTQVEAKVATDDGDNLQVVLKPEPTENK